MLLAFREGGMDPKYTDPDYVLKFSRAKIGQKCFVIGLISLAFGIFFISFGGRRDIEFAGYVVVVIGFALCMYEMHRHFHPGKPMLALSPEGVRWNIEWVRELFVPWHEVKALRKITVTDRTSRSPFPPKFENVTALVVTNDFYDRALHVDNVLLRGPGWGNMFIADEKNGVMQFALHDEILPVKKDELYAAVETRWKAFRDKTKSKANKP